MFTSTAGIASSEAVPVDRLSPVPSPRRRPRFSRLLQPVRYARRNPRRAALWAVAGALLVGVLGSIGGSLWFHSHLRKARVETDRWHNTEAIRRLSTCALLWSDHPDVLLLSARVARRMGAWADAELMLKRYAERHGEDERLAFERLLHRAAEGDLESTFPVLRSRIQRGGAAARDAREALIIGLSGRFLWLEARTIALDWLAESPDDAVGVLFLAKITEEEGGQEQALRIFRRVVELDPEQTEARLRLSELLVTRRRGEEALVELTELRKRLPKHPQVQVLLARALSLLGRHDEARAAIEECLEANPDYPGALLERGSYALLDGDEANAEVYLRRAAQLDPANPAVRSQFALALARNGKVAESAREYAEIRQLEDDSTRVKELMRGPLQTRPNDPAIHHEIGMIALRGGQTRAALRWFQSSLKVDPDYLPTHKTLAALYHDLDNPVLSARHWAIAQRLAATQPSKPQPSGARP